MHIIHLTFGFFFTAGSLQTAAAMPLGAHTVTSPGSSSLTHPSTHKPLATFPIAVSSDKDSDDGLNQNAMSGEGPTRAGRTDSYGLLAGAGPHSRRRRQGRGGKPKYAKWDTSRDSKREAGPSNDNDVSSHKSQQVMWGERRGQTNALQAANRRRGLDSALEDKLSGKESSDGNRNSKMSQFKQMLQRASTLREVTSRSEAVDSPLEMFTSIDAPRQNASTPPNGSLEKIDIQEGPRKKELEVRSGLVSPTRTMHAASRGNRRRSELPAGVQNLLAHNMDEISPRLQAIHRFLEDPLSS